MKNRKLLVISIVFVLVCLIGQVCAADSEAPTFLFDSVVRIAKGSDQVGSTSWGTGFFISDTLIATNHHCVSPYLKDTVVGGENWNKSSVGKYVTVIYNAMQNDYENALILNDWPEVDLAIVQLSNPTAKRKPVTFLNPEKVTEGMRIYTVGFPGVGAKGVVNYDTPNISSGEIARFIQYKISTDIYTQISYTAITNQGNSGGIIADSKGRIVGIVNSSATNGTAYFGIHSKELLARLDKHNLRYTMAGKINLPKILAIGVSAAAIAASVMILLGAKNGKDITELFTGIDKNATVEGISGEFTGKKHNLSQNYDITFGRDHRSTYCFDEKQASISANHCSIHYSKSNSCYALCDYDSTNGTFLQRNGVTHRVPQGKAYRLHDNDVIMIANDRNSFKVHL